MPSSPTTVTNATTAVEVARAAALFRDVCARLDPAAVHLVDVEAVFDSFVAVERLAGGAVTRLAARYAEAGAWRRSGARSVEDDIGLKTGTTVVRARRQLATSKRLGAQRGTDDALRLGVVSGEQAVEVSDAVEVSPSSEGELLRSARLEPLHQLRRRVAASKAAADTDREATRRRLHHQRSARRWNDADGMGNLLLKLPADEMAEIDASLKGPMDRIFAAARRSGRVEPSEAYAADAVAARLLGTEPAVSTTRRTGGVDGTSDGAGGAGDDSGGNDGASDAASTDAAFTDAASGGVGVSRARGGSQAVRPDKKVIAVIDIEALNRGSVEGDEQCEIAGVGPVSVSSVRRLLNNAFLAVVIKDGIDIRNVTHLGRRVTAWQRTALESRGGACEFCGSRFRVEIDHVEGWALTHTTEVDDLSLKCWHCHDRKTRLGLTETGPPGNRTFLDPDGTPRSRDNPQTADTDTAQTVNERAEDPHPLELLI